MVEIKPATIGDVYKYFAGDNLDKVPVTLTSEQKSGYTLAQFRTDWAALSPVEKRHISSGIGDGTFNYAI